MLKHFGKVFGSCVLTSIMKILYEWNNSRKKNCNNVTKKPYQITEDVLEAAVNKIQLNKATGWDLITGFWYKKFDFYKPTLTYLFEKMFKGEGELPIWLNTASTILLPKNNDIQKS